MYLNEALVFLTIFTISTLIGYYIINRFHVTTLKKFELLISYMGAMAALLLIYNIYIAIRSERWTEKNQIAYDTLQNINRNYLMPQKELIDFYPEGYFLYASMNQDTDLSKTEPKKYNSIKRDQIEVYMSLRVFQAVEDFLSTGSFDQTGSFVWINNFLMWMQSPILQKYWRTLFFNYSADTRKLIDEIIEKANALVEKRKQQGNLKSEDYDTVSQHMVLMFR